MKLVKNLIGLLVLMLFSSSLFSQNHDNHNFTGKYQSDMQYVQLIHEGGNKFIAKFTGDCDITTKEGTVNNEGVLEIPFVGENQMQTMFIRKGKNGIVIKNSDNSPMMQKCNGATLAGIYEKR